MRIREAIARLVREYTPRAGITARATIGTDVQEAARAWRRCADEWYALAKELRGQPRDGGLNE